MTDHYRTLEIPETATPEEIKAAYRKLAKKYHPDKNRSDKAEFIFNEINKAYEVLKDTEKRTIYDNRRTRREYLIEDGEAEQKPAKPRQPKYSKSTIKKGKIFGVILLLIVIVIPLWLLRFSSRYNYELALDFYKKNQIPETLSYLDKAINEFGSRKIEATFKAVSICYNQGYIIQGITFAQKGSDYISNQLVRGNLAYREGLGWEMLQQKEKANLAYKNALKLGYTADSVYIHLAMMHGFELENYDEAVSHFDHLIEDSGLNEFKLQRGIIYQNAGKVTLALRDLEAFVKSYPENLMGHFFLGISLAGLHRTEEACKHFEIAGKGGISESDSYLRLYCEKY